jgi:hypothetical protein
MVLPDIQQQLHNPNKSNAEEMNYRCHVSLQQPSASVVRPDHLQVDRPLMKNKHEK